MKEISRLGKKLFFLMLPMLVMVAFYVFLDPFRIIYPMKTYYPDDGSPKNVDYISGEVYLKNSTSRKYDSFIFGSSRSEAFKASRWKKYIDGLPFHFHASCEGVWGIFRKLEFLDKRGVNIKNAILVLDKVCLRNISNPEAIVLIKHPGIAGSSWEAFHMRFFKAFIKNFYFYRYVQFRYFNGPRYILMADIGVVTHDAETNDVYYTGQEAEIARDSINYYRDMETDIGKNFGDSVMQEPCIDHKNIHLLKGIANILAKHQTKLKVVISPMSDHKFFNQADIKFLKDTFGEKTVYDFSDINSLTTRGTNYYDYMHYKPLVADSIMSYVYSHTALNERRPFSLN